MKIDVSFVCRDGGKKEMNVVKQRGLLNSNVFKGLITWMNERPVKTGDNRRSGRQVSRFLVKGALF